MKIHFVLLCVLTINIFRANPRVSIIAFLDEYTNIEKTVEQINKQTKAAECEILLINCGIVSGNLFISPQTQANLRVISSQPPINGKSFNRIITQCQGEFIMILPSGDSLNPRIIEEYTTALDGHPEIDAVYANLFVRYEDYAAFETNNPWYHVIKPSFDSTLLYYNLFGTHCMWRKSMHARFGIFNEKYNFYYLLEFWNRAYLQGASFKKIETTSGNCFLPYGTHKKLFNSIQENENGYQEYKAIYQTYHMHWQRPFAHSEKQKSFVIITASYKNAEWYKRNLDSLFNQNYDNYHIIYIDDASPDGTGALVQEYINQCGKADKITLIRNTERLGAVANIYKAAHLCHPEQIILIVDGDDWLAHENVLNRLNEIYQDPNVWATYGQFMWFPFALEGFAHTTSPEVVKNNNFRGAAWNVTHLRTYYASLYQKIKKEDLMYNDEFYPMTGDLAVMYPIMEMAGTHSAFVPDILYIYNAENSINDNKVNIELQGNCGYHILCKEPYKPLDLLFS